MANVAVVWRLNPFNVTKNPFMPVPHSVHRMIGPLGRLAFEVEFHRVTGEEKSYWFDHDLKTPDCAESMWYDIFLAPDGANYYPAKRLANGPIGRTSYSGELYWLMGTDGHGVAQTEQDALELWARWTRELVLGRLVGGYGTTGYPQVERISTYALAPVYPNEVIRKRLSTNLLYLLAGNRSGRRDNSPSFYLGADRLEDVAGDILVAADAFAALGTQKKAQSLGNEMRKLPADNHPERDWGVPQLT